MPAIVVEDFDLTKSNKHEKNWMHYHPFLNVMLHVYISTTNMVKPISKV